MATMDEQHKETQENKASAGGITCRLADGSRISAPLWGCSRYFDAKDHMGVQEWQGEPGYMQESFAYSPRGIADQLSNTALRCEKDKELLCDIEFLSSQLTDLIELQKKQEGELTEERKHRIFLEEQLNLERDERDHKVKQVAVICRSLEEKKHQREEGEHQQAKDRPQHDKDLYMDLKDQLQVQQKQIRELQEQIHGARKESNAALDNLREQLQKEHKAELDALRADLIKLKLDWERDPQEETTMNNVGVKEVAVGDGGAESTETAAMETLDDISYLKDLQSETRDTSDDEGSTTSSSQISTTPLTFHSELTIDHGVGSYPRTDITAPVASSSSVVEIALIPATSASEPEANASVKPRDGTTKVPNEANTTSDKILLCTCEHSRCHHRIGSGPAVEDPLPRPRRTHGIMPRFSWQPGSSVRLAAVISGETPRSPNAVSVSSTTSSHASTMNAARVASSSGHGIKTGAESIPEPHQKSALESSESSSDSTPQHSNQTRPGRGLMKRLSWRPVSVKPLVQ